MAILDVTAPPAPMLERCHKDGTVRRFYEVGTTKVLHCADDRPAVEHPNGRAEWHSHGKLHRDVLLPPPDIDPEGMFPVKPKSQPAVVVRHEDGSVFREEHHQNGKMGNLWGPAAVEYGNDGAVTREEWAWNGRVFPDRSAMGRDKDVQKAREEVMDLLVERHEEHLAANGVDRTVESAQNAFKVEMWRQARDRSAEPSHGPAAMTPN